MNCDKTQGMTKATFRKERELYGIINSWKINKYRHKNGQRILVEMNLLHYSVFSLLTQSFHRGMKVRAHN
jgi:hypothetical protein